MYSRSTGLDNFLSLIEGFQQLFGNFSPTLTISPPGVAFGSCPGTDPCRGSCGAGDTAVGGFQTNDLLLFRATQGRLSLICAFSII